MLETLKATILKPTLSRAGTVVATWLVATGAPSDLSHAVGTGVVALGLVLADFAIDYLQRRAAAVKGRP